MIILIVSLVTNSLLKVDFILFLDSQNQSKMQAIVETLTNSEAKLLLESNYTNELVKQGFIIVLTKDTVWFDGFTYNYDAIEQLKSDYKENEKQLKNHVNDLYSIYETTAIIDGQSMLVHIYNYRPALITSEGIHHLESFDQSSIIIGVVALTFAVILSYLLTSFLIKPMKSLLKKLEQTKQGDIPDANLSLIYDYQLLEKEIRELSQLLWNQKNLRNRKSRELTHELRTPLTATLLTLENIDEGVWEYNDTIHQSLKNELNRLKLLVEDIHELEQIEMQTMSLSLKEVQIKPIIEHVLQVVKPLIEAKSIDVNIKIDKETVLVDSNRFQQIIMNVIHNAVKYGVMNGHLFIKVTGNKVETIISIKDDGIGMSQDKQLLILNHYYRTHDSNEDGSGMGLAIVKELIEAHGGQLLIFSELNVGTEVVIVLSQSNSMKSP